ncbi:MAG: adenosylcobinamide-GDP ribazoletransferase [Frankiales bacterium]|nr:adenosylcobinamide-GDP ribazoletransferase [Frankiales bacterium]MDX6246375.1 adenosylcobinamide-GDP ribazoletransferase [Frankiales bacterium]
MTSSPSTEPRRGDGLRLALTTFTVLPVGGGSTDRRTAGSAMLWAPVVGAALGGVLAVACRLLRHSFPSGVLLAAVLAVLLSALLTRGLHLDGLADTVDGLGCYGGPERALAVMRAPDVGPFGVAAIVLVLLVEVAALGESLSVGRATTALLVAFTTGRLAVPWACTPRTPAARPDGLGALVAGTTSARTVAALTLGTACLAGILAIATGHHQGEDATRAVAAVVVPLALAHGLRAHAVHRFGGVTGDVLGALVELTTASSLLVMAVGAG